MLNMKSPPSPGTNQHVQQQKQQKQQQSDVTIRETLDLLDSKPI